LGFVGAGSTRPGRLEAAPTKGGKIMGWHPAVAAAGKEERFLRPHQVAQILGVSSHQVRKLWRQGKLPGEKLSERNLVFPESAVREYRDSINEQKKRDYIFRKLYT